jgi:hypothetical protein
MTDSANRYPKNCRKNICRLRDAIGTPPETAYGMMLLTAALMDLNPYDDEVTDIILEDCGISPDAA